MISAYYKDTKGVLHRIDTDAPLNQIEDTRLYIFGILIDGAWSTGHCVAPPVLMLVQGGKT